jgi:hypothetical protein
MAKQRQEQTSARVASKAARLLNDARTPKAVKSVAASALTQRPSRKSKSK